MSLAREFNDLVAQAARQTPLNAPSVRAPGGDFLTQWEVTVQRLATGQRDFGINPLSGEAYFSAAVFKKQALDTDRMWRVEVGEGCVNGVPAQIADLPLWGDPAPGLIATTPSADTTNVGDFQRVVPAQRPKFFRTEEAWDSELWRCSVFLSGVRPFTADPLLDLAVLDLALLPDAPTLVGLLAGTAFRDVLASIGLLERIGILALRPPYKVHVGTIPLILDGTENFRVAWLYLLRTPGRVREDQMFIQQLCFWNLAAFSLLEDEGMLALSQLLSTTGNIGVLTGLEIVQLLLDSARVRWWTR